MPSKTKQPKQPKFVEKIKSFDLKHFNYDLKVIVSSDPEGSRILRVKELGPYERDPGVAALTYTSPGKSILFLPFGSCIGWIAHEVYHVMWHVMKYIGADHENEVMAYHIGNLTKDIAKFCYEVSGITPAKKRA
jgi:hypothetical protein